MVIVQEFGQLLAQAFIALALMAKHDCAFEEQLLKFLRQMAPEIGGGRPKHQKVAVRQVVACAAI